VREVLKVVWQKAASPMLVNLAAANALVRRGRWAGEQSALQYIHPELR